MIYRIVLLKSLLFLVLTNYAFAQQCDPYHSDSGGFGYLLKQSNNADIWWCEGAYKIMKDTKAPLQKNKNKSITLWSAKNEYEPFQIIINPLDTLKNLKVSIQDLKGPDGSISASNVELRMLEYVKVSKPTDSYGYKGYWPDPIPEIDDSLDIYPGSNFTLWINIYTPDKAMPGIYKTIISLKADAWSIDIPLQLNIWDFTLPKESSMKSGFGLSVDKIADYHNITERDDLLETFDLYMQAFRRYKISPYSFYYLHQIKKTTEGIKWKGAFFDSSLKHSGKYSLRVEDNSALENSACINTELIPIETEKEYKLNWYVRSEIKDQQYTVLIEGFDSLNNLLYYENRAEAYQADTLWKQKSMRLRNFGRDVSSLRLSLFPVFRSHTGEEKGIVWFDDISLIGSEDKVNLLSQGDIEFDIDNIDISLDFSEFDYAAKRYLDEYGFNSFRLNLQGMGSGTYYSREKGIFEGFEQGSPEYEKLMALYLSQIELHLKENGWLGKEYVYWFDEPGRQDYPFVREGMELIRKSAPGITTFITENDPGPEIMDVTDITCTIWHRIDPAKARTVREGGQGYWSYLCTAPKAPWVSEFIDHDAINLRIWLWMSYSYKLNGILIWSSNYWTSRAASSPGYLQNPWEEPASFVQGYGWPLGKQTVWGNGDGRFWYPPNRHPNEDPVTYVKGPVPSIRLEFLRQGIEDYEYLVMLDSLITNKLPEESALKSRASKLLSIPGSIFTDGKTYTKNPKDLLLYRQKLAKMILEIQNKTR